MLCHSIPKLLVCIKKCNDDVCKAINRANAMLTYCLIAAASTQSSLEVQDFVRMLYPNATESNVRQLMSMARDQKATYKVTSLT